MDITVLVTGSESQRNGMECCNGAERERERERSEGREVGQSNESRVCVEDCRACEIIIKGKQSRLENFLLR
jgi:hypothetical protein